MDLMKKLGFLIITILLAVQQIDCSASLSTTSEELKEEFEKFDNLFEDSTEYSSTTEHTLEVSKSAMDIITVVWYLSTFLALAAFFFLMACSDRRCGRGGINRNTRNPDQDSVIQAPPTPAPSYREFAPPSYESVMKQTEIFVVPVHFKVPEKRSVSESTTVDFKIETINELQKNG